MRNCFLKGVLCFLVVLFSSGLAFAQLGKITLDMAKDKPAKFKTQTLKSEKTGQKKFTFPRRLMQNTVSHYNYYFNATNKIREVIEKARLTNNDVYYRLLPFYSYSLKNTAQQTNELDSVIYKATAGILLHDLRTEWVDNFYLLIGKAYLLKQAYDSASMTFQFINYNLYPKSKKDDDQVVVGSNLNNSSKTISIANKENEKPINKILSRPPSRNDALVWQVRTLIEAEEYSDAAGLINTLHNDVNFPSRLRASLEEVNAYWFYKQGIYDSAAAHLENALSNATDLAEKARSEYLLAQLFERTRNLTKASEYYNKAMKHTPDPLLDIYANLSEAKMYDSSGHNEIDKSIEHLLRMAKRDKFEAYRNLIYYSAGELALEKPDTTLAELFLRKGLTYPESDAAFKNKSFLKLADINFARKNYQAAFSYYDSLQTGDSTLTDLAQIQERRGILSRIVNQLNIIQREDSLQHIALMPPPERETFIKSLAKKLKKAAGIKDEDNTAATPSSVFASKNVSQDIFASNKSQGEWYFYNSSVKAKGYTDFVSRWGKRQNVDNWRTSAAGDMAPNAARQRNVVNNRPGLDTSGDIDAVSNNIDNTGAGGAAGTASGTADMGTDISYEGLLANVPTTPEKLDGSNTLLSNALFDLGKLLQSDLEDYRSAVQTYDRSLERYPDSLYGGELYMNLWYCYQKLGNMEKANYYKNLVTGKFGQSKFAQFIKNPKAASVTKDPAATKKYEAIYNLFIEGQFEKALQEKRAADSIYANNYWTPQLLYIESVYYIKQKADSLAINVLNDIINTYPKSPLKGRAEIMIDVLNRRQEIEDYLTNLTIERYKEDEQIVIAETPAKLIRNENNLLIKKDSATQKPITTPSVQPVNKPEKDSVAAPLVKNNPAAPVVKEDVPAVAKEDVAAVVKDNVPPVEKDNVPPVVKDNVSQVEKENVPAVKDNNNTPPVVKNNNPPAVKDNGVPAAGKDVASTPPVKTTFDFEPGSPQFVVMLLDKVDPVYISEARNAFLRYNREKFSPSNIEIVKEVVDKDKSLLVFRQFTDAAAAINYSSTIKKDAASEVSWLPANKYSFFIISDANLQLLKQTKDLQSYLKILHNSIPDKF